MQSGPTYDQQPAFSFLNASLAGLPHEGLPDVWRMPWVQYSPALAVHGPAAAAAE